MEKEPRLNREGEDIKESHQEAIEFVERNRGFYEHYARGAVRFEPAPEGLDTFAFDLEADPPKIYLNSRFYKNKGLSDEKTSFATLHEAEHLLEKRQLLSEKNGARIFKRYLEKLRSSKAFNFLDNRVADLRENRAVVSKTNEEFGRLKRSMYKEDLVQETDFTSTPRHIQFVEALSREGEVSDERCTVAPEVRAKLDEIANITNKSGLRLVDVMTHPDTPMSIRLKLEDRYLWPIIEELMKQDLEDEKQNRNIRGQEGQGGGAGEETQGEPSGESVNQKEKKGRFKKKKKTKKGSGPEKSVKPEKDEALEIDPNEVFKEAYKRAMKRVPNAVPLEEIEKAFKKWEEGRGNLLDRADKEYASNLGVKVEDLRRYRSIVESLQNVINPETRENVIEELKALFPRIISRRLKPIPTPRYPVEEGEDLVDPAGLISGVKGGELEPKVWETTEVQERPGKKFGEVEITLIFDRSGSMEQGSKLLEQRKAAVMAMEALKEFSEQLDEERINMTKPLEIRTEIYSFQATAQDGEPLKKMSKELSEKDRIRVSSILSSAPGQSTTDFVPLEVIKNCITEETLQKIKEGELKKITIIFTDGESGNPDRVKLVLNGGDIEIEEGGVKKIKHIEGLREIGVIDSDIGVTKDGQAVLTTYAPNGRVAEKAEDLVLVLSDLLKEHLADV